MDLEHMEKQLRGFPARQKPQQVRDASLQKPKPAFKFTAERQFKSLKGQKRKCKTLY